MNKSDMITQLSENMALQQNKRVEVRGFGSFVIRKYHPYVGRNPKTGERIHVDAKRLPFFKTGKNMKIRVNSQV